MATWQQGINSGGFLAGIGGQNSNAPKASDVSEALAYIRQNNEMERSGRNNIGIQALQGLGSVAQAYQAAKQQEADAAFQKEYAAAIQSGDRQQVRNLMTKYPRQLEKIQSGMKWADEDQRDEIGNLAAGGQIASMMGGDAFSKWIGNNATRLSNQGVDPQQLLSMYQKDPQATSQLIGQYGQFALGHEKYWDLQDKMVGRQQDQQKINETIRNNDMTNARGWASNNIAQQNVNLRRMELEDKKYDRLIANETNALKLAELQDKRLQNQQAMEQAKRDKADAYNSGMDNLSRTIETATKVLNSPGFTGYFGTNLNPLSSRFIPGTEAADTETLVDTLKSQGFLSGIQQMKGMGALSNAEGQKVMDAIGSLSPNQSEKSARAAIKTIIKTTEMAQKRMQQKYGKDIQPSQQQLSDDDLINKYLGGQ
ncbi:phage DNA ejection protein [Escherichia coli]|uniref:phage DNA ejection protein n=2 Tax=Escherichia coli TaxID=562 RepID=UPI002272D8E9|nr:phage DNA ejection protein [Escherichia coli]EJA2261307.1 phage DNA ejection protein [Escherichia coli]EJQ0255861.1 phage DNA ejection protein [Escherichia coli]EJR8206160.1 phage DNA ejection protein [Escherichia coli]EJR8224892.1 phage DNA ejection protein [Escherichia coli]EJU1039726.1 phage DNA ejection protein [Escherichia coli]